MAERNWENQDLSNQEVQGKRAWDVSQAIRCFRTQWHSHPGRWKKHYWRNQLKSQRRSTVLKAKILTSLGAEKWSMVSLECYEKSTNHPEYSQVPIQTEQKSYWSLCETAGYKRIITWLWKARKTSSLYWCGTIWKWCYVLDHGSN